jgi:hypothetical protein
MNKSYEMQALLGAFGPRRVEAARYPMIECHDGTVKDRRQKQYGDQV